MFSVNWLENTDASNTNTETLEQQWKTVAKLTNLSQVCQWGVETWTTEPIGDFVGETAKSFLNVLPPIPDPISEINKIKYA